MKLLSYILFSFLFIVVFVSCRSRDEQREKNISPGQLEESLLEANKQAVLYEDRQIDDYIRRQDWKMQKTGTGLRYMIYEAGKGSKAEIGSIAELEYTVQLINGDQIYSSDIGGIKKFLIGKGGVEAGLEEGILLLHEGDRAKFIIPSHLAFGLAGDRDKIPPKATLIYDVKLLNIKR